METELEFLSKIYQILSDEKVFDTKSCEENSVIEFKFPHDLKKLIDFSLEKNIEEEEDDARLEKLCRQIIRFSVKTNRDNFMNQLYKGTDPYALAGAWITDAMNSSQYTFEVAPCFTLVEEAVLNNFLRLFGFKDGDGIFCPGGSNSNMNAMVLARYKLSPDIKKKGILGLPQLVAFSSEDAHYSIQKGVGWLGIGTENVSYVKTNERGQMITEDLERLIKLAIEQGKKPFFVNATAGTTVLGSFDKFHEIADVCEKYGVWMHIDACLGGSLIYSQAQKHKLSGVERANSLSYNPHKTLGVPLQCSMFLVKEKGLLYSCNSANASYLFQQDKFYDVSYDTGDKSVQCGRKIDAFKFWLMYKKRGIHGIERLIDNAFELADHAVERMREKPGYQLVLDEFEYTNVCFWYIPKYMRDQEVKDEKWWANVHRLTGFIKEKMVMKGNLMVSYQPLQSKRWVNFFRLCVTCHPVMTKQSMDFVIDEIERIGESMEFFDKFERD